jgi:histidinol-phosphatase
MTPSNDELTPRLRLAVAAAKKAGELTLDYFRRSDLKVEQKADNSPVTVADREAERMIRQMIASEFPDDGILGEEMPETVGDTAYRWILDPIDGTKSFVSGVPLYANLVGVETGDRSAIGVINIPALGECVYAAVGQGAWYEMGDAAPVPARVAEHRRLADGLFVTSEIDCFRERNALDAFLSMERAARVTRTWGDAYGYLLVATGRALAMVDAIVSLWDIAAIQPVIEEAGGRLTDWQGNQSIYAGDAIGANPAVLDEILSITRPFSQK